MTASPLLSHWGDQEAQEKDRLLEQVFTLFYGSFYLRLSAPTLTPSSRDCFCRQFVKWANAVRDQVVAAGHWLNFTDPASGYPVHGDRGGMTCNDVDVCLLCTKFPTVDLGVCKILSHPEWKTAVYPTTMVTTAPLEVLTTALSAVEE